MKPATVIFDMGNVILPFDPLKPGQVLAEMTGRTARECVRSIYDNKLEYRFEMGEIDGRQFTEGSNEVLGLSMTEQYWRSLWSDMFSENEQISGLVRQLRPHHRLILLSNTNQWHYEYALATFPIISEFDHHVLSFEVHAMKPEIAIYEAALRKAGDHLPAVFIDDIEANALGAEQAGIKGIWFRSAEQLRNDLIDLGCDLD